MRSKPIALLVAALLAAPGCSRHYIVSLDELYKLDGYTRHTGDRRLLTSEGDTLMFNASNELWLLGPEPEVRGRFKSIRLTPTAFEGVPVGATEPLRADVASIQFAKVEATDNVRSMMLTSTIAATALGLAYVLWITRPQTAF